MRILSPANEEVYLMETEKGIFAVHVSRSIDDEVSEFKFVLKDNDLRLVDFPVSVMETISLESLMVVTGASPYATLPNESTTAALKSMEVEIVATARSDGTMRPYGVVPGNLMRIYLLQVDSECIFSGTIVRIRGDILLKRPPMPRAPHQR